MAKPEDGDGDGDLTGEKREQVEKVRKMVSELREYLDDIDNSRSIERAKTHLDETEMWAVRGIATGT